MLILPMRTKRNGLLQGTDGKKPALNRPDLHGGKGRKKRLRRYRRKRLFYRLQSVYNFYDHANESINPFTYQFPHDIIASQLAAPVDVLAKLFQAEIHIGPPLVQQDAGNGKAALGLFSPQFLYEAFR